MSLDAYRFVFVITYARSGSTLLQSILNSTPGVLLRGENHGLLFHLFKATQAAINTQERGKWKGQENPDTPWFGAGKVAAEALKTRLLDGFITDVLAPPEGVEITGFKEIRHTPPFMNDTEFEAYIAFLLAEFPGAKLVFNARDASKVSQSAWLKNVDPKKTIAHVKTCDRRFAAASAAHPESCFHVQYEDFTANPDRFEGLFSFLDLPYDKARIDAVLNKPLDHAKKGAKKGGGKKAGAKAGGRR